jgi:hypothetical protein
MVTHKDIQLRQAIWADYRSGNNEYQAFINVRKKFDSVSPSKITFWYNFFKSAKKHVLRW